MSFFRFSLFPIKSKQKKGNCKKEKAKCVSFAFINTCVCRFCTCPMITFWPCYYCETLHLTWRFFCGRKEEIKAVLWKKNSYPMSHIFLFLHFFPSIIFWFFFMVQKSTFLSLCHIFFLIVGTLYISNVDKNNFYVKISICLVVKWIPLH